MQEFEDNSEIAGRIAENIKKLRKEKGYSQVYLADLIVRSREHISRLETGRETIGLYTFIRLAEVFGVSLDELAGIK
ncbi:MAG: helix-turn-helix domain-containing protein [Heliobacteriaceae bacterium]|jgi:transcriptional regulator with XRE-family HTH domain|nr:helix-turn-helix domain-containing protein [Heliobacteriaceae bacterium]